ncbi:DMT family transporter [Candidatus Thorarchaeota archaeon]|nr:MAG: DMT family transporter [Candidatus Thorarchaeota archaeon]
MSENVRSYIALIFAMFLWGASWVSVKILVSIAPIMTIGFFRYSIAGLLFLILLKYQGKSPRAILAPGTNLNLLLAGLTGVFGFMVFSLIGTQFTTASQASIIAGLNPITVGVFAYFIHQERSGKRWQYSGFIVAFIGIIFVIGVQALIDFNPDYLIGNSIIVLSMICWGIYSSVGKSLMGRLSPVEVTAGSVFVGWTIFAIGAALESNSAIDALLLPEFWINVGFLGGLSAFLGFVFYFQGIQRVGATRAGVFISLVPVFGTITAVLILDEPIYWTFLVGLTLVVSGILILNAPVDEEEEESEKFSK